MSGRHRRSSNIITAIKISMILVAAVFLIIGGYWIYLSA